MFLGRTVTITAETSLESQLLAGHIYGLSEGLWFSCQRPSLYHGVVILFIYLLRDTVRFQFFCCFSLFRTRVYYMRRPRVDTTKGNIWASKVPLLSGSFCSGTQLIRRTFLKCECFSCFPVHILFCSRSCLRLELGLSV